MGKPTLKEKQQIPQSGELKIRVIKAKLLLPKSGITSLFFHYFQNEYKETVKNKSRLNNVLQSRLTDKDITEKLEELVVLLTNK
jgi:translation initiation factor 2 beta subunit (eIF-2beta)/eIF-5